MKSTLLRAAGVLLVGGAIAAQGQSSAPSYTSLVIYPAKGQTDSQMTKDKGECQAWSQKTTGIDPAALAQQSSQVAAAPPPAAPPPSGPSGERARGAVRGAAAGAIIGEVADNDAGKGAAIGATTGVVAGGARARQNQRTKSAQQQQAAQQSQQQQAAQQAKIQQDLATYTKGYTACLEGRGYTVK